MNSKEPLQNLHAKLKEKAKRHLHGLENLDKGIINLLLDLNEDFACMDQSCLYARSALEKLNRSETALRESEERYRLLENYVLDLIWTADSELNLTYLSPSVENLLGFTVQEALAMTLPNLLTQDSYRYADMVYRKELGNEKRTDIDRARSRTLEIGMKKRDGGSVTLEMIVSFLRDEEGKPVGLIGAGRDISLKKNAELALKSSEQKYRLVAENVTDVIWTMDLNRKITFFSPSVEILLGYTVDEALHMRVEDFLAQESLEYARMIYQEEYANIHNHQGNPGHSRNLELMAYRKDGSEVICEVNLKFLRNDSGEVIGHIGTARDITQRKIAEKRLRQSELKYRSIFDTIHDGYYETDLQGNIQLINSSFARILGYERDDLIGKNYRDIMDEDNARLTFRYFNGLFKHRKPQYMGTITVNHRDGHNIKAEGSVTLVYNSKGSRIGFCGIIRDATDRLKNEQALRASEERFRKLYRSIPGGSYLVSSDRTISDANRITCEVSGYSYEELVGEPCSIICSCEDNKCPLFDLGFTKLDNYETTLKNRSGESIHIIKSVERIATPNDEIILANFHDITRVKQIEEMLRENEETLRKRNQVIEDDLKTAQLIQKALITGSIEKGSTVAYDYRYLPLEAVGGDFFSVLPVSENSTAVFIGDVSSHGVSAALFLSLIKATVERLHQGLLSPQDFIFRLNNELIDYMPMSFLTGIYGIFTSEPDGTVDFTFSSGGHPSPVVYRADTGEAEFAVCRGTLIGEFRNKEYRETSISLNRGDRVYLYTDGIPEAINLKKEIWGFERLPEVVCRNCSQDIENTLDSIIKELEDFRGDMAQDDDIIIVAFEI